MISTSNFKTGLVIKHKNEMFEIIEYKLVKMQQRQPIVRTKLKNIKTGSTLEQAFRSGDKFDEAFIEEKPLQYLYHEGDRYYFMDTESYHEVVVSQKLIAEKAGFMKDNSDVIGKLCDGELYSIELPPSVTLAIAETDPGVRGDTAKSGSKPAKVEAGGTIKVPLFVNIGDKVRVDTRTYQYIERV